MLIFNIYIAKAEKYTLLTHTTFDRSHASVLVWTLKDTTTSTYEGVDGSSLILFLFNPFFFSAKSPSAASFSGLLNRTEKDNPGHRRLSRRGHEETTLPQCQQASSTVFVTNQCTIYFLGILLFLFFKRMSDAVMLSGSIWSACRKVSIVFGILHHCVKSIKSYTKEIGSLPPLTFTVRWLIGFCFVANYKTHSSYPTCPLSRGKTIKSHNWAKIVFQLILKCHLSHRAILHPQLGNNLFLNCSKVKLWNRFDTAGLHPSWPTP